MELTIEETHRARLYEVIRMCDEHALRSALIGYLVSNAYADDCCFFLDVLTTKLHQAGKMSWGADEVLEDLRNHLNN